MVVQYWFLHLLVNQLNCFISKFHNNIKKVYKYSVKRKIAKIHSNKTHCVQELKKHQSKIRN